VETYASNVPESNIMDPYFSKSINNNTTTKLNNLTHDSNGLKAALTEVDYDDNSAIPSEFPATKRVYEPYKSNYGNRLIGGDGSKPNWKSTTTSMFTQESTEKSQLAERRDKKHLNVEDPEEIVSSITNNTMHGDWLQRKKNAENKLQDEKKKASEEEENKKDPLMFKVRQQFAMKGAHGIVGIARLFKIMDDDGSKNLSLYEFKKAMREYKLALSDNEIQELFKKFGF
jgi:hypothetical protein